VTEAIRSHFNAIQRPEIYNRLGENIVVFDFIDHKTARPIFEQKLGNIVERVKTEHDVIVELAPTALEALFEYCTEDLDNGGRSIVNRLEAAFVNPLTRPLFARLASGVSTEATWRVLDLNHGEEGFDLDIE
jgi:ATP-dependent Clp protease ATP-binding subunit ClpA